MRFTAGRKLTVTALAALALAAATSQTALAAPKESGSATRLAAPVTTGYAHLAAAGGKTFRLPVHTSVTSVKHGDQTVWSVTQTISVPKSSLVSGAAPTGRIKPLDSTGGSHDDPSSSVTASLHLNYTSTTSGGHPFAALTSDTASWSRDTSVTWSSAVIRAGVGGHKTDGSFYGPAASNDNIGNPTSGHVYTYVPAWHGIYVRVNGGNNYQTVNSDIHLKYQGGSTYDLQFPPITLGTIV